MKSSKLKKTLLAVGLGVGFGLSSTAIALPGKDDCLRWWAACEAGTSSQACADFYRFRCWVFVE